MRYVLLAAVLIAAATVNVMGQAGQELYSVFDGSGRPVAMEEFLDSLEQTDVVFLGEFHDDSVGHAFQFEVFKEVVRRYGSKRAVALSLEMFESDVQHILDEYLEGLITEDHFLASSRPWKNYKTDYRPLVEFAKENRLPVIAANAPRRYVNMVSRGGRDAVGKLPKKARKTLAPRPFPASSAKYREKFMNLMKGMPAASGSNTNIENILESQTLWDATMAYRISRYLKKNKRGMVVHLNGSFHTESRLGTAEQLANYRKKARFKVVTIRYEKDFKTFDQKRHEGLGDFVVLTDSSQPRSGK